MSRYEQILANLQATPKSWIVTGVAGFIGSNLLEILLGHEHIETTDRYLRAVAVDACRAQ